MIISVAAIFLSIILFCSIGCIALWRNYNYFSDGIAHASVLAAVLSQISAINSTYIMILVAIIFAVIIFFLSHNQSKSLSSNILSNFMLALGISIASLNGNENFLTEILFGDILAVSINDLILLIITFIFVIFWIRSNFENLIFISISPELAIVKGVKVRQIDFVFLLLLALIVSISLKLVGSLMVGSLLVIPAATAMRLSSGPKMMFILSISFGLIAGSIGSIVSFRIDTPVAPTIAVVAGLIYLVTNLVIYSNKLKYRFK